MPSFLLEAGGVDLVLSGHSHAYERSGLLDGYYLGSDGFDGGVHLLNSGDGNPAGDGAYHKTSVAPAPHQGTVYAVVGSSSKLAGVEPHVVMESYIQSLGSMVIDIQGSNLDARFIDQQGQVGDYFRIEKGTP